MHFEEGRLHRLGGPAIERWLDEWWVKGKFLKYTCGLRRGTPKEIS